MRPSVRWLLFSFFLLGAGLAIWVDFSVAREHFWWVLVPLISGGGMVWIFCFGREARQKPKDLDEKKTDT